MGTHKTCKYKDILLNFERRWWWVRKKANTKIISETKKNTWIGRKTSIRKIQELEKRFSYELVIKTISIKRVGNT